MDRIFTIIAAFLARLTARDLPADPLARMTPRELADLPVTHPAFDDGTQNCAC